jgi:hypothetical protein
VSTALDARTIPDTIREARALTPLCRLALVYLRHGWPGVPITRQELAEAIGCTLKSAYDVVEILHTRGLIRESDMPGPARYTAT